MESDRQGVVRSDPVDALRGIAVAMIIVLHAAVMVPGLAQMRVLDAVAQRLSTGIQLFFLLSGYLISISLEKSLASGIGLRGFYLKRVAKIVPLYLVFLHLGIAVYLLAAAWAPEVAPFRNGITAANLTAANYLSHLLFLQGFDPPRLHSLLDGSWSIACEVYFYLLSPLLILRLADTIGGALWLVGVTLLAGLAFTVLAKLTGAADGYGYYGFPAQLVYFAMGILCQRLRRDEGVRRRLAPHGGALALIGLGVALGLTWGDTRPLHPNFAYAVVFAIALVTVPDLSRWIGHGANHVLVDFGRRSYAMFLGHLFLLNGFYVLREALHLDLPGPLLFAANLAVGIGLTWLLAWLVFDRIDRGIVEAASRHLHTTDTAPRHA